MHNVSFNPKLICAITGQSPENIPAMPTPSMLPGSYGKLIAENLKKITLYYKTNKHNLICGHCGKKTEYDLGLIAVDAKGWRDDPNGDIFNYMQTTGYFRCIYCNGAGQWNLTDNDDLYISSRLLINVFNKNSDKTGFMAGVIELHDGTRPKWATNAEEHLLSKLNGTNQDAFIWNRLGNYYLKGRRPDLGATAFEQSLNVDMAQIESHYSLGDLLYQIGEYEKAAYHLRMALIYADRYDVISAQSLRECLTSSLQKLFKTI